MTNAGEWLGYATQKLDSVGIGTARLDALILLEDCSGKNRAHILANPDLKLSEQKLAKLNNLLKRRMAHEPLAYIRGHTEFYGRNYVINKYVLEPRPESETMIDILQELIDDKHKDRKLAQEDNTTRGALSMADVGTGSGAIGITAKFLYPESQIDLIDIDENALKVAKSNVVLFSLSMSVIKSDLLRDTAQDYDILLCNLPYVPDDYQINESAGLEPKVAIFGGPDGLDIYRKLFKQVKIRQNQPLYILTESLPPQHKKLASIANSGGYSQIFEYDFIQIFKIIL